MRPQVFRPIHRLHHGRLALDDDEELVSGVALAHDRLPPVELLLHQLGEQQVLVACRGRRRGGRGGVRKRGGGGEGEAIEAIEAREQIEKRVCMCE
jgi:hypothetical protein